MTREVPSEPLHVEQRDGVTVVSLRHGKVNALDLELCEALRNAFEELASKPDPVILTASGSTFSAGVDLVRLLREDTDYVGAFLDALTGCFETLFCFPRPLIAAVGGHAIAGGCVLAATADHRVMTAASGRIGLPELVVGVPFPAAAVEILRFVVPVRLFGEVLYGHAVYEPAEAIERGLVDEVAPTGTLFEHARRSAERLARVPAPAFRLTKSQMRRPVAERIRAATRHDRRVREVWATPATREAIAAYVARTFKRPP